MRSRTGFTFLELVVTLTLILTLVALLLPVFAHSRESARRISCESNLRQIVTAAHLYAQDNNGKMPVDIAWTDELRTVLKQRLARK